MTNEEQQAEAASQSVSSDRVSAELVARNRLAAALLDRWLREVDAYDQEIWPLMEQELESLRTSIGGRPKSIAFETFGPSKRAIQ